MSDRRSRRIPVSFEVIEQFAAVELAALVENHLGATIFAKEIITHDNPTMVIDA